MIRNMMLGGGVKHGDILYDTDGQPAAVITGSRHSEGREPWNIRGRRVWIAVGLASKRGVNKTWCTSTISSDVSCNTDLRTIENPTWKPKLAANNIGEDNTGTFVSRRSTEAHMDASFTYSQTVKNSEELTDAILAYSSSMQAAAYCRTISLSRFRNMDLPSIDVLMRIYQSRNIIDELDTTVAENTTKKMSNWGFNSLDGPYVWSASERNALNAWFIHSEGLIGNNNKDLRIGVVPVLEIPA